MTNKFTNTIKDGEVTGYNPDGTADYYLIGDHNRDHKYWQETISKAIRLLSTNPTLDCMILYGGVVSDSGSSQIDISAGAAVGKDSNGDVKIVEWPAQTNLVVPSDAGAQTWVVAKYESLLDSSTTRVHFNGETYHHVLEDSCDGVITPTNWFVTADPNAVADSLVCLGSFTMTAGVYAEVAGERSPAFKSTFYVQTQAEFDSIIENVAGSQYRFLDEVTSVVFDNLSGGYQMPSSGAGYLQTNNCVSIEMKGGAFFDFNAGIGYLETNTDDCYLRNMHVQGNGSIGAVVQSYLLNASRVTHDNCKCSNRNSNVAMAGFQGSGTALHNITSKYINCTVYTLDGTNLLSGFEDCSNINNGLVYDLDSSGARVEGFRDCSKITGSTAYDIYGTADVFGFHTCVDVSGCKALQIDGDEAYGFYASDRLSSCSADDIDGATVSTGFFGCGDISACISINVTAPSSIDAKGFDDCENISACHASTITTASGDAYGFYSCSNISACTASTISGNAGDAYGFYAIVRMSACEASGISSSSGSAYGFHSCQYGSSLHTSEASNPSNDYMDTTDVAVTNKVSCATIFT